MLGVSYGRDAIESYKNILGSYSRTVGSILNIGQSLISHPSSIFDHDLNCRHSGASFLNKRIFNFHPLSNVSPHHSAHNHLSATLVAPFLDRSCQEAPSPPPHPTPPTPTSPPRQVHPSICHPPLLDVQRLRQPPEPPHKSYQPRRRRARSFHSTERRARG